MRQYIRLHNEIKQQASMLRQATECRDVTSQAPQPLDASVIMTGLDAGALGCSSEVEECCICMENSSDVILHCAHSYCEKCIDQW